MTTKLHDHDFFAVSSTEKVTNSKEMQLLNSNCINQNF